MAVLNFDIKSISLPDGEEAKAVFLSGSIDASTNQTFEGRLATSCLLAPIRSCWSDQCEVHQLNWLGYYRQMRR